MVDLSNLKLVEEQIEVADDSQYVDATDFPPPPPEGIYTFIQGKPEFGATDDGYLKAEMNHVISGGEQDGKPFNFDRISNKPFERQGVKVNMMRDHLRAVYGPNGTPPRTHDDYAQLVEQAEGKPFKAVIQWEAGCNHKDTPQECEWTAKDDKGESLVFRLRGESRFPAAPNGGHLPETKCGKCGQTVQARARISRRITAESVPF